MMLIRLPGVHQELTHGGGKGGQKMKKTRSAKLIIKEVMKYL
jgi:hypothetical protein